MATFLTRETLFLSGALLLVVLLAILLDNGLVPKARARTREALASIEVQLKRRADLVPNLVFAVKGYAAHERRGLDEVAPTRAEVAEDRGRLPQAGPIGPLTPRWGPPGDRRKLPKSQGF